MDISIDLCHLPSPPSSLWTAVGGWEEGGGTFQIIVPELFWAVVNRTGMLASFSPSMGNKGRSGTRRTNEQLT